MNKWLNHHYLFRDSQLCIKSMRRSWILALELLEIYASSKLNPLIISINSSCFYLSLISSINFSLSVVNALILSFYFFISYILGGITSLIWLDFDFSLASSEFTSHCLFFYLYNYFSIIFKSFWYICIFDFKSGLFYPSSYMF